MEVIIYPFCVWLDNKNRPVEIVKGHSDESWMKLIRQMRHTCNDFDDMYGVRIHDVQRWKDDLIIMKYEVTNDQKWQNQYDCSAPVTLAALINHNLRAGGYPSFYDDNNEDGEMIFEYLGLSEGR